MMGDAPEAPDLVQQLGHSPSMPVLPSSTQSTPLDSMSPSRAASRAGSTDPSSVSPSNPPQSNKTSNLVTSTAPRPSTSGFAAPVLGTAKRRRLTSAEKEVRAFEKAQKDAQREGEKQIANALQEEKRREKEEARLKREADRAKKQKIKDEEKRVKDEEKRVRDEEKQRKEEEIAKKGRAQTKLSFFTTPAKPKLPSANSFSHPKLTAMPSNGERIASPARDNGQSDFKRMFLPFEAAHNVTVADQNRFYRDEQALSHADQQLDRILEQGRQHDATSPASSLGKRKFAFTELCNIPPGRTGIRGVKRRMHTRSELGQIKTPSDSILPTLKYIRFHQDVRPPYVGTYTKSPISRNLCSLGRRPFQRLRPDTNYEEDSEAEWEEPEEGEELLSEADDDASGNEDDELDDFLDDEDDTAVVQRRGATKGDLVPLCSGIQWEDLEAGTQFEDGVIQLQRMDILLDGVIGSIDPYSTAYWAEGGSSMPPPPLPTLSSAGASRVTPALHAQSAQSRTLIPDPLSQPAVGKQLIDSSQMEAFKHQVSGSDMTKIMMIEHLKRQFRGVKAAIIKDTLDYVAERVGTGRDDKKWMLRSEPSLAGTKRTTLSPISNNIPALGTAAVSQAAAPTKPKKVLDPSKIQFISS